MELVIAPTRQEAGRRAAEKGAQLIREALAKHGEANIIVATGASQFDMLDVLVGQNGIDWSHVTAFHLDEYVGLPISHPASFRLYLWQRFVSRLPFPLKAFHYLDGEGDCRQTCEETEEIIARHPIDVAFVGIGENGHLAFNDPPADFDTQSSYLIVDLNMACREQQVSEGWFANLEDVPRQAISMSVAQILKSSAIICTVPDQRKAEAVRNVLQGPITPDVPASILQFHSQVSFFLDEPAGSLLYAS